MRLLKVCRPLAQGWLFSVVLHGVLLVLIWQGVQAYWQGVHSRQAMPVVQAFVITPPVAQVPVQVFAAVHLPSSLSAPTPATQPVAPSVGAKVARPSPMPAPHPPLASANQAAAPATIQQLLKQLAADLQQRVHYPAQALADNAQGEVIVSAVLQPSGQLTDLRIAQSSGHVLLDQAALQALQSLNPIAMPLKLANAISVQAPVMFASG